MSIKKMIYSMLSALLLLSILSTASTFSVLNQNKDNGKVVNYAGKVRGTAKCVVLHSEWQNYTCWTKL